MALASGANLYPGSQAAVFWRPDVTPYPYSALSAAPTPVGATVGAYFDIPEVTNDDGAKGGRGIGARQELYDVSGLRAPQLNENFRIADLAFLAAILGSLGTGSAEFGTPDFQLFYGAGGTNAFLEVIRYAKANTAQLNWQEGSAAELMAQVDFWGLARQQASATRTPTYSELTTQGTPFTWHNFTVFRVKGQNYRDQVSGINLGVNNMLERKTIGTDTGDDQARSRTSNAIMSNGVAYTFSCGLHSPQIADALWRATSTASDWSSASPALQIGLQIGTKTLDLSWSNARFARHVQRGGTSDRQMAGTLENTLRGLTVTYNAGTGGSDVVFTP